MMKLVHRFRVIAYAVMALLSASLAVQAQSPAATKAAARAAKVSTDLLTVINDNGIDQKPLPPGGYSA